jgi:hypothetical protein
VQSMKSPSDPRRGLWHLVSAPDVKRPGTLRTEADGRLVLELSGVLGAAADGMPNGQHRLVGQLDDFETACLEGCFVIRGPRPFSRAPTQTWHVGEALFGAEFGSDETWTVRGAEYDIVGLTKWSRGNAFDPKRADMAEGPVSFPLWTDEGVTVDLVQRVSSNEISETVYRLEAPINLRVIAECSLTRPDLRNVATRPLQALIGLATGKYGTISRRFAMVPFEGLKQELSPPLAWHTQPLTGNLDPGKDKFGFLYQDLRELRRDALQSAYLTLKPLHLVLDLYLASLRETGYAEVGFNLVAQALESFHRLRESRTLLSKQLWKELRQALDTAVKDQATKYATTAQLQAAYEAVGRKVPHLNQITFRDRLQQLLENAQPHVDAICGRPIDDFLTAVVQTRNFYVHWDDKPGGQVVRGADAVALKSRMLALLEISLLHTIGFPSNSASYAEVLRRRVSWLEPD